MMKRFITQTPEAQDCTQQEDAQERGPIQESLAYRRLRRSLRSFYQFFIVRSPRHHQFVSGLSFFNWKIDIILYFLGIERINRCIIASASLFPGVFSIFHRLFYGLSLFRFVLFFHERFRSGVPLYLWVSLKLLQRSPP